MNTDEFFIRQAIEESKKSISQNGDPFGALLVKDNKAVASSGDYCVVESDPTRHAELNLISQYCHTNKIFSLEGYTLYSNVEPCIMCAGAIHWSRISRVVFSVSQSQLKTMSSGNPKPTCKELLSYGGEDVEVIGSILSEEAMQVLSQFSFSPKLKRHNQLYLNDQISL